MCGCGLVSWCEGGCSCGCKHATLKGQTEQAKHFALQYDDMTERAMRAFKRGRELAAEEIATLPKPPPNKYLWKTRDETGCPCGCQDALTYLYHRAIADAVALLTEEES